MSRARAPHGRREVVVSGLGIVSPYGLGTKAFWSGLAAGACAIRPITVIDTAGFRSRIAAEIPADAFGTIGVSRRRSRADRIALAAARAALGDRPGGYARCRQYARRMWCEQSFRDEKAQGFHWDASRVDDPRRATRLLVLLALATLLCVAIAPDIACPSATRVYSGLFLEASRLALAAAFRICAA